jgi:hypothetical protein
MPISSAGYKPAVSIGGTYDFGGPPPVRFFCSKLLLPGPRNRVILGAPVIFRHAPFGADPSHLHEAQQCGINRSLVELKQIATGLLNI